MTQPGEYHIPVAEFFGEGTIHIRRVPNTKLTTWEWQIYIADEPQHPEPEEPSYQTGFRTPGRAYAFAIFWMSYYFLDS